MADTQSQDPQTLSVEMADIRLESIKESVRVHSRYLEKKYRELSTHTPLPLDQMVEISRVWNLLQEVLDPRHQKLGSYREEY